MTNTVLSSTSSASAPVARRPHACLLGCIMLGLLLFLPGCSSRVSTADIRADLSRGDYANLQGLMQEAHDKHQELVTALNLGRVLQLQGRWQDSISAFDAGLAILEEYESRALVNMREIFSEAGSILLARGSKGYYGTGYERSLLHTFNAMNYLMLGNFSGAAVEMRKMEERQEAWLAEESYRLQQYIDELDSVDIKPEEDLTGLPGQYSLSAVLNSPEVRSLASTYQDAFSYSLSAVVCRLAGDPDYARVSMRRAALLDDGAYAMFSQNWKRGSATARKPADLSNWQPYLPPLPKSGPGSAPGSRDWQEVTVVFFEGLAPALQMEHVRIPAPYIGYVLVDLPSYAPPLRGPRPRVESSAGREIALYPLLHTELLAYRTLRDEVRYEIGSAVSRAITRAAISGGVYAAAASNEDTEAYAPLLSFLTTVVMDLVASGSSESVRNWETLPVSGFLGLEKIRRGEKILIKTGVDEAEIEVPAEAGGVFIMVSHITTSRMRVDYVIY